MIICANRNIDFYTLNFIKATLIKKIDENT